MYHPDVCRYCMDDRLIYSSKGFHELCIDRLRRSIEPSYRYMICPRVYKSQWRAASTPKDCKSLFSDRYRYQTSRECRVCRLRFIFSMDG
jgi:hypothetical protein